MNRNAVFLAVSILLLMLCRTAALAADYDVSTAVSPLHIPAGSHRLYGGTASDLSIVCVPGVTLTLDNVDVTSASGCALSFAGAGNELILAPGTTNSFASGQDYPGISVATGIALAISGSGTIAAAGGYSAAGSGGGSHGTGGTVSISGGTVTATGGGFGAGIGGGLGGNGGTVIISGGAVAAYGGDLSAGIGGGLGGNGGTVTLTGGNVYAAHGSAVTAMDIGKGTYGSANGTLILDDGAAVFLEHDRYANPTIRGTQTHYTPVPFVGNTVNGITVPAAWTIAQGAFLPPVIAPQTGDSSQAALWLALIAVSGTALAVLVLVLRRKQRA